MGPGKALELWGRLWLYRLGRPPAVAWPLVEALGDGEDAASFAGILLTRAGRSSEPLLVEALARQENVAEVLMVLASIGDELAEHAVSGCLASPDPAVASAAEEALRVIRSGRGLEAPLS